MPRARTPQRSGGTKPDAKTQSKPATRKKPTAAKTPPAKPRPKYDWRAIRREYIRGSDEVTLKALSDREGYPTHDALKQRSSREDWADLRAEFRHQVTTRLQESDARAQADVQAEVRSRLTSIGAMFIELGTRGAAHLKPEKLEPIDVARFAKIGADLQVKAAGMDELKVRLSGLKSPEDLDKLDEGTLWRLAGMLPPEEDDDPDL